MSGTPEKSAAPLQYQVGDWDFRFLTLKTDPRALIPRPETEQLVQLVLDCGELFSRPSPRILDVGTGTGCIILSLARERPQGKYFACDVSPEALSLARENAEMLGLSAAVDFTLARNCSAAADASLDAVVSNPPYIPSAEIPHLCATVRDYEPHLALDGGADGLDIYRELIPDAARVLIPGGRIFLEIDEGLGDGIRGLLDAAGFSEIEIKRDFAHFERYAVARLGAR